jgi:RND family efflux transporter MFP subunit
MSNLKMMMKKRKVFFLVVLVIGLLAVIGLGTWKTVQAGWLNPTPTVAANGGYTVSAVRKGSLAISVLGNGKTVAVQSYDLAFAVSGTLAELKVQVGDQVSAGQELASLDTLDSLNQTIANNQLALQTAQKSLDALLNGGEAALAQALADQSAAAAARVEAQNDLHDPHDWRCPDNVTAAYYKQYEDALVLSRYWQGFMSNAKPSEISYYQMIINPILKKMNLAYENYTYCQAYTPQEIADSQANLQVAQANLAQKQAVYQALLKNNGIDLTQRALAEAQVKDAQQALTQSEQDLQGATLRAPAAGTVTAVNGSIGEITSTGTFLTIVDLTDLEVQATIDETDLSGVGLNCPAQVSLTSLPAKKLSGKVTKIEPVLVSSGGASVVQIKVALDSSSLNGATLPLGGAAAVIVTCSQTQNALLIPAAAIQQNSDAAQFVYVLNAQNQPEKRTVTVGLTNGVTAEILSGLQENEKVIPSEVKLP